MTPIIIISGEAGSGKDTFADFLVAQGAIKLAQADPMKELVQDLYGFSDEQLWGRSELRNTPVALLGNGKAKWNHPDIYKWLSRILDTKEDNTLQEAYSELVEWTDNIEREFNYRGGSISPRYILQTLGTEWGRDFSKNLWSDYSIRCAKALLGGNMVYGHRYGLRNKNSQDKYPDPAFVVITDGRFKNELINVLSVGGLSMRIYRNNVNKKATEEAGVKGHASEAEMAGIPSNFYTHHIINNGTLADLKSKADAIVYKMFHDAIQL